MENLTMEKLTNYCKNYGFIFQGSEIYGGLANSWDFGPLGAELKRNISIFHFGNLCSGSLLLYIQGFTYIFSRFHAFGPTFSPYR